MISLRVPKIEFWHLSESPIIIPRLTLSWGNPNFQGFTIILTLQHPNHPLRLVYLVRFISYEGFNIPTLGYGWSCSTLILFGIETFQIDSMFSQFALIPCRLMQIALISIINWGYDRVLIFLVSVSLDNISSIFCYWVPI